MSRLMSVSLTTPQVLARTKVVTRRRGWLNLRGGDELTLCRKVMGRRKGEPLVRLTDVRVLSVRRERLYAVTADEVVCEGFPEMTAAEFVEFFCRTHKGCTPETEVTRIRWLYLGNADRYCACNGNDIGSCGWNSPAHDDYCDTACTLCAAWREHRLTIWAGAA